MGKHLSVMKRYDSWWKLFLFFNAKDGTFYIRGIEKLPISSEIGIRSNQASPTTVITVIGFCFFFGLKY